MSYTKRYTNNGSRAYDNPNQDPNNFERWSGDNIIEYKDAIYDRISELLLLNFSKLEIYAEGNGISAIQKTYKNGNLVTGKNKSDVLVVYESDIEANSGDRGAETRIINWLDFTPPEQLTMEIVPTAFLEDEESEVGLLSPPNLILKAPGKNDLNINEILGELNLTNINLTDNVSQFMEIEKVKTNINRTKLLEYIDVDFSELSPITFTHLLEKYNKLKKDIPFYRYRTEDFFNEYSNSNIPIAYRIQKFFEEFEKIKLQIPAGTLQGISSEEVINELGLFGYGTMTYLMKEARVTLGDGNVLEWSTNEVSNFINEIDALKSEKIILEAVVGKYTSEASPLGEEASGLKLEIELLQNALASATASDLVPSDDPTEIITEVTPPGFVQESTYFSDMGYVDLNEDTLVDIEDVKLSLRSDIVVPTIQTSDEIIQGCTDSTAINYNLSALIDDGSCTYAPVPDEPTPVFNASFDDWQDAYSPSNYWFRSNVGVVVQTDGPDGIGDGAMRIYRTAVNGSWPGAMYNPKSKSPHTIPEFNIEDRVPDQLYLQEGRTYKIGLWGRCNTTDKNAMMFIGDTRTDGVGSYSWEKLHTWQTNNIWTYSETTFSPVKNAFSTLPTDFKFEYWEYPGGASPSWGSRLTEEPISVEEYSTVNKDWGAGNIAAGKSDNILLEINGYINLPSTGTYTFDIAVDDGVYLWVDSETVISSWVDGAQRTVTGTKEITASGAHKIKIRYYEHTGTAVLKLYVKGPGISGDAGGYISPTSVFNPTYEPFAGVMASMYLYAGTYNGGSPGQYCDYANVKIEELASQTTQMRLGGRTTPIITRR